MLQPHRFPSVTSTSQKTSLAGGGPGGKSLRRFITFVPGAAKEPFAGSGNTRDVSFNITCGTGGFRLHSVNLFF
jgi:hypothetical protein